MAKKKAVKKEKEQGIEIPEIEYRQVKITLTGTSPLLVNRFDEKSKKEIDDKQQQKAKQKKLAKDPVAEFKGSLYVMRGKNKYGMPTSGIKKCAVSACRFIDGVPMTVAKGAFHVLDDGSGLTEIKGGKPVMDERIVRVGNFGNKKPTTRYRGRFDKWSVTFPVTYNSRVINSQQLLNLYENAGFSVGLCEYRPEKDGSYGMFQVKRQ